MVRGPGIELPPCQAHRQGWGLHLPNGPLGAEEVGQGGWGLRSAQRPEGGEERGETFWRVSLSSVQPASPPSNLLPDIPGKSLFLLRLMAQPR